jgi:hypothetical protein
MHWKVNPRLLKSEPLIRCRLGDCHAACCQHGTWIDMGEADKIHANARLVIPFMPAGFREADTWFEKSSEADPFSESGKVIHSTLNTLTGRYRTTACVFLRADDLCALQVAAIRNGFPEWELKPFYCILHPLDLDEEGRITLEPLEAILAEEASCLRANKTLVPLLETFEPELRYFLGNEEFKCMKKRK